MSNVNPSAKFVDNNMVFTLIPTPKLGSWIFTISIISCFQPSSTGFTSGGGSPIYEYLANNGCRFNMVCSNTSEGPVRYNTDPGGYGVDIASFCRYPYAFPIGFGINSNGLGSKLELRPYILLPSTKHGPEVSLIRTYPPLWSLLSIHMLQWLRFWRARHGRWIQTFVQLLYIRSSI